MAKFKKGDIVICIRFAVSRRLVPNENGATYENFVDTKYFNREAIIEETYKECEEKHFNDEPSVEENEDKGKYVVRFLDNNCSVAWFDDNELILKTIIGNGTIDLREM